MDQHLQLNQLCALHHIDPKQRCTPSLNIQELDCDSPLLSCLVLHGLASALTCSDTGVADVDITESQQAVDKLQNSASSSRSKVVSS